MGISHVQVLAPEHALKELSPDYLIPMHCSGIKFYEIAKQECRGASIRAVAMRLADQFDNATRVLAAMILRWCGCADA